MPAKDESALVGMGIARRVCFNPNLVFILFTIIYPLSAFFSPILPSFPLPSVLTLSLLLPFPFFPSRLSLNSSSTPPECPECSDYRFVSLTRPLSPFKRSNRTNLPFFLPAFLPVSLLTYFFPLLLVFLPGWELNS